MFLHDFGPTHPVLAGEWGTPCLTFDEPLLRRLGAALARASNVAAPPDLWTGFVANHTECAGMLRDGCYRDAHAILSRLFSTPLAHGYQQGDVMAGYMRASADSRAAVLTNHMDKLLALAAALGACPAYNPEQGDFSPWTNANPDTLLDGIEARIGAPIVAPPFQGGLWGMKTRRGLFSERDFIALYVALRIRALAGPEARICEIGGGAGYLAYYARLIGLADVTIVDLPTVGMAQGYFLAQNIGARSVVLPGEPERPDAVKLWHPADFLADDRAWTIVVNVDSFPEIAGGVVARYLDRIARAGARFLSCNHEAVAPRSSPADMQEAVALAVARNAHFRRAYRFPFWLRRGYVEELYVPH